MKVSREEAWNIINDGPMNNENIQKLRHFIKYSTQPQPTSKEVEEALTMMGRIRLITLEDSDNIKIRYTIEEKKEIQNAFVIIEQALQLTKLDSDEQVKVIPARPGKPFVGTHHLPLDSDVVEAISRVQSTINLGLTGFRISPPVLNKQFNELKKALKDMDHTAKEVYIIMSPEGGIGLDISTSKGKCFTDLVKAEKELKSKNDWSKAKGYGTYDLVTLEVKAND